MPKILYFTAEWCAPCRRFGPLLTAEAEARGLEVVRCDIDTEQGAKAAQAVSVMSVPTVLVWEAGQAKDRFGYMPAPALRDRLDAACGR